MVFLFCRPPCVSGAESSDAESAASNFSAAANVASCLNWNPPPRQRGGPVVNPPKAQSEEDTCITTVTERSIDQEQHEALLSQQQEELSRDSQELKQEDVWQKLQTSTTSLSLQTTPNTMEISADSCTVYDDDTTAVADNRGGLLSGPLSSSDLNSMTSWLSSRVEEDLDYYEDSDESSAGNWEPILEEDEEDLSSAVHSHISGDDHADLELGLDLGLESDADESSVGIAMETAILPLMQQRSRSFPPSTVGSTDKTKSKNRFSKILLFNILITLFMAMGILDLDYLLEAFVFRSSSSSNQQDSQLRLGNFLLRRQSHANANTTFSMFESAPRQRQQSRNNHHAPMRKPTARTRATVQSDVATTFVPTAERKELPNMPMSPANFMSDLVEEDTEYMPTDKFEGLIRSDSFLFGIQQNNKEGEKTQPPPPPLTPVDDTNWTLKLLNLRLHVQQQPEDEEEPFRRFRSEQPQRPPVVVTVWKLLVEAYQRLDIHVRGQSQMAQFKQHHWNLKVAKALSTFDVM